MAGRQAWTKAMSREEREARAKGAYFSYVTKRKPTRNKVKGREELVNAS